MLYANPGENFYNNGEPVFEIAEGTKVKYIQTIPGFSNHKSAIQYWNWKIIGKNTIRIDIAHLVMPTGKNGTKDLL